MAAIKYWNRCDKLLCVTREMGLLSSEKICKFKNTQDFFLGGGGNGSFVFVSDEQRSWLKLMSVLWKNLAKDKSHKNRTRKKLPQCIENSVWQIHCERRTGSSLKRTKRNPEIPMLLDGERWNCPMIDWETTKSVHFYQWKWNSMITIMTPKKSRHLKEHTHYVKILFTQ